jgi:hypothetical protein
MARFRGKVISSFYVHRNVSHISKATIPYSLLTLADDKRQGTESFLTTQPWLSWSRNSLPFMDPDSSSPCSQEPVWPRESSPHPHILIL